MASLPFVIFHFVPLLAIFTGIGWHDWMILLVTYWVRVFFITAGYHRYFGHRSYKTSRWFQFVLAFGGSMAVQKGPLWWAGNHRLHHRFSDTVQDAHSPIKGVFFSHVGWILATRADPTPEDVISDFAKFPELRFLNRHDWIGPWLLAVLCLWWGGWSGLVVGFFLSTVMTWHATFLVNSLAHLWGTRRYATADSSRNNFLIALLVMGEGWHNNHHHLQSSCRQGFKWWEIDMSYYVLRVLSWVRIVHDLKAPNPTAMRTALIKDGAYDIGMFRYHWDKATTRVASATQRTDLTDTRVRFSQLADETLAAAEELGRQTRRDPAVATAAADDDDGGRRRRGGRAARARLICCAPGVSHAEALTHRDALIMSPLGGSFLVSPPTAPEM
ncbi:MAG: acyl-CoA desaturase [Microthrixaceae bacterium]